MRRFCGWLFRTKYYIKKVNRGRVTVPLLFHCSTTFAYLIYI